MRNVRIINTSMIMGAKDGVKISNETPRDVGRKRDKIRPKPFSRCIANGSINNNKTKCVVINNDGERKILIRRRMKLGD